ncbi:putative short-chain dehydrogenase [Byssothecium circinans]|uniref:Putative short-chain dehydrogenase n=1 Tax=Byssothecium circinans TaxID=147558 RepID=A0A6A5U9G0_9PLEO|nr:putative short-chain dehydrogenase [Byssothecium circinans]
MAGTIVLTGANGSAGLHASEHLLKTYPEFHALFTVRNSADTDVNTNTLRDIISRYPNAKASIHQVDLADLTSVQKFASTLSAGITAGQYFPLKAIICNAYYWNLVANPELTVDGHEKTLQIGFIAHAALVLRLLDKFGSDGGRIELISSIAHYRRKTQMSPYIPEIPANLEELARPQSDNDKQGRGFQRYANSKLIMTTWTYALNRYLQKDSDFYKITAVAQNPGNMGDSRAFRTNTPSSLQFMQKWVMKPLMPVVRRFVDPTFRPSIEAGIDMVELAVNKTYDGERGYFTLLKKDDPDSAVLDEETQQKVWAQTIQWAKITKDDTALKGAFE